MVPFVRVVPHRWCDGSDKYVDHETTPPDCHIGSNQADFKNKTEKIAADARLWYRNALLKARSRVDGQFLGRNWGGLVESKASIP
jgi:hypothetical protein